MLKQNDETLTSRRRSRGSWARNLGGRTKQSCNQTNYQPHGTETVKS